jgi:hypothetical protein
MIVIRQIYRTMVSPEEARKQINPKWTQPVPIPLRPSGHISCIPLNKNTRLSAGVAVRGTELARDGRPPPLDPKLNAEYNEEAQQMVRMVAKYTRAFRTADDHDDTPFHARNNVAMLGDALMLHFHLPETELRRRQRVRWLSTVSSTTSINLESSLLRLGYLAKFGCRGTSTLLVSRERLGAYTLMLTLC